MSELAKSGRRDYFLMVGSLNGRKWYRADTLSNSSYHVVMGWRDDADSRYPQFRWGVGGGNLTGDLDYAPRDIERAWEG